MFESKNESSTTTTDTSITSNSSANQETKAADAPKEGENAPVINVEPTLVRPQLFLMMKDFSDNPAGAKTKQDVMFNNLDFILVKNHLLPEGPPAAWHSQQANLYQVEVGVPLAKKLHNNELGTYYKQTKRTPGVVAHFFGRRSLLPHAYDAIKQWLIDNHKTAIGDAWEVYESDHRVMKDNDFLETDVYMETK